MKNSIKRMLSVSLAAVMLAGLGTSCGKGGAGETRKTEDGKIIVKMWSDVNQDSTPEAKEEFEIKKQMLAEKFPDYQIEFIERSAGHDYRAEYDKDLMAGDAPDVFTGFSYTDIPTRMKDGSVAEITELVENWQLKKDGVVIDTFDEAISKDGKWYAIPRDAYVQANLYNVKELAARGYDVANLPETWEEFAAMGEQVADRDNGKFGYELMGMDWCAWPFTAWVWSAGGEMVRENGDGTYTIAFNEEPGVDAAKFLNDMIHKHEMTQKDYLCDMAELKTHMQNGSSVASFFTIADVVNLKSRETYGITPDDYLMTTLPVKDSSITRPALAGGEVITFNPTSSPETLKAAFDVITYLYYDEEYLVKAWEKQAEKGNLDMHIPARKDLQAKKFEIYNINEENINSLTEMQENSIPEPYCPHWTDVKSELVVPLQAIFAEPMEKDQIKKLLDECADKLYSTYSDTFVKK